MDDNESFIQELVRLGYISESRIASAFRKIDRANFVPTEYAALAYANQPVPIGLGQTISQPLVVAFMLEQIDPQPGEKILEIGAGSGWKTALLAYLVGPEGRITAMERLPEMCGTAEWNIRKLQQPLRNVDIILGDGSYGAPEIHIPEGGFDKVVSSASAEEIPKPWLRQLKTGGRIVAPVGHSIYVIDKLSDKRVKSEEYPGFAFVPLIQDEEHKEA